MKVLIDMPEKEYNRIKGKTEVNYSEMWIAEGTPLDDLTNGEVMMKMFPNHTIFLTGNFVLIVDKNDKTVGSFDLDWWNRKWGE